MALIQKFSFTEVGAETQLLNLKSMQSPPMTVSNDATDLEQARKAAERFPCPANNSIHCHFTSGIVAHCKRRTLAN